MPQVLDIPNQVPREASKIYYHYIYWFHDTLFGSNILPIQKPNLQELLDFQKKDNTVNKNSILIKKSAEFYKKLKVLFCFSPPFSLSQPFLQSPTTINFSIAANFPLPTFFPYLFTKPSSQSLPKRPSSICQLCFTSLFLHTATTTILTKNVFPYLSQLANSVCIKGPVSERVLCGLTLFSSLPASLKHGER